MHQVCHQAHKQEITGDSCEGALGAAGSVDESAFSCSTMSKRQMKTRLNCCFDSVYTLTLFPFSTISVQTRVSAAYQKPQLWLTSSITGFWVFKNSQTGIMRLHFTYSKHFIHRRIVWLLKELMMKITVGCSPVTEWNNLSDVFSQTRGWRTCYSWCSSAVVKKIWIWRTLTRGQWRSGATLCLAEGLIGSSSQHHPQLIVTILKTPWSRKRRIRPPPRCFT